MARTSRSGQQSRPLRRLILGVLVALGLALVLAQTAPQISNSVTPVRASAEDWIAGQKSHSWWQRLSGQAARDTRIQELEREVRELARWRAAAIAMAERMEAYEDILNLQGEPPELGVTARIAAETDGPFSRTILANAGLRHGIDEGDVAVNEAGLVGRVIHLGEQSSRILLVTDFNSRVPVLGEVSGVRAILQGRSDGWGSLAERPELDDFVAGERILTSGEGGAFPRGILVGYAERSARDWRARLVMTDARSGYVRLLPKRTIPKPEETALPEDSDVSPVANVATPNQLVGQ